MALKDTDIRRVLHDTVFAAWHQDQDARVVDEMALDGARVDVAVVADSLYGFEIKSDSDSIDRLTDQARIYTSVFDRLTLVVGSRLHKKAEAIVPECWGITLATERDGVITLTEIRPATPNAAVQPLSLASLLWRGEMLAILEERGLANGYRSKSRKVLIAKVAAVLTLDELKIRTKNALKARGDWRATYREARIARETRNANRLAQQKLNLELFLSRYQGTDNEPSAGA